MAGFRLLPTSIRISAPKLLEASRSLGAPTSDPHVSREHVDLHFRAGSAIGEVVERLSSLILGQGPVIASEIKRRDLESGVFRRRSYICSDMFIEKEGD